MTIQGKINALEMKIQELRNDTTSELAVFASERKRAMIAEMVAEKDLLWHQERQQRAANKKSHGRRLPNIRDI